MRNLLNTLTNDKFPNLQTKSIISVLEDHIIEGILNGTKDLTVSDVRGAIMSNCPKLLPPYNTLLQSSIEMIDWNFIKDYLEAKPLLEKSDDSSPVSNDLSTFTRTACSG